MYNSDNENKLIIVDIVDAMADYTSIQIDIDETKVKSAELVAQNIDIKRVIGKANLERCINPSTDEDKALTELVKPALCYFTYTRCLKMFQGTFTDSGYTTETQAEERDTAKAVANEYYSIADSFMQDVIDFLEAEGESAEEMEAKLSPNVRVFGGEENRASN